MSTPLNDQTIAFIMAIADMPCDTDELAAIRERARAMLYKPPGLDRIKPGWWVAVVDRQNGHLLSVQSVRDGRIITAPWGEFQQEDGACVRPAKVRIVAVFDEQMRVVTDSKSESERAVAIVDAATSGMTLSLEQVLDGNSGGMVCGDSRLQAALDRVAELRKRADVPKPKPPSVDHVAGICYALESILDGKHDYLNDDSCLSLAAADVLAGSHRIRSIVRRVTSMVDKNDAKSDRPSNTDIAEQMTLNGVVSLIERALDGEKVVGSTFMSQRLASILSRIEDAYGCITIQLRPMDTAPKTGEDILLLWSPASASGLEVGQWRDGRWHATHSGLFGPSHNFAGWHPMPEIRMPKEKKGTTP